MQHNQDAGVTHPFSEALSDHLQMDTEHQKEVLIAALEAEFNCSRNCAASTVESFYPDEEKCRSVVKAKMSASFVEVVGLISKQRECLDRLYADLRVAFANFPLLNGTMKGDDGILEAVATSTEASALPPVDWAAVREALFSPNKAPLWYAHAELANVGVPNDLLVLENAYRALATNRGFSHLLGCYASGDGVVTAVDYVNERLTGTPVQELARRMQFEPEVVMALNGVEASVPTPTQTRVNVFGNNPATSHAKRQDKGSSQSALRDAGLAYIRSVVTTSAEEALEQIHAGALLMPVVVKPSTGAGSEFVTLCYTEEDVRVAFEMVDGMRTCQGTDAAVLVVEEYIEGPEYVVNTVSYNGVAVVTDVWQSWKFPKAVCTTGMSAVAEQSLRAASLKSRKRNKTSILYDKQILFADLASLPPEHEARRVTEYTLKCLDALELRNGCAHCELRVDMRRTAAARRGCGDAQQQEPQPQQTDAVPAGSSPISSTTATTTPIDPTEERGEPVLIELNPRMQGDAPRSTNVVGYDQFSLMVYIGEAANTFGGATAASTQLPFRAHSSASPRGDIPWPPVPRLYHALDRVSPPCTAVLFLVASADCILNGAALPFVTALPSFERFTRTIFKPNMPNFVTPLRQTVDLFSSPSACVLCGTPEQVEADCQTIRAMETADVAPITQSMLQDAVSKTEAARHVRSALHSAEGRLTHVKELLRCVSSLDTNAEDEGLASTTMRVAEAQKVRDGLLADYAILKEHLEGLRAAIKQELANQSPLPLYISSETFNLMKHCDLGSMLSVQ